MQLVFSDVLRKKTFILQMIDTYFRAMSNQNTGKASTMFQERAAELNNIVLANQTYQETRFVRSLLRGLTAALRNLPTIHGVLALEYNDCAKYFHNRRGLELQAIMDELTNAEVLFFTIGFCQLLELYAIASLESQHSAHFPIQVNFAYLPNYTYLLPNYLKVWQFSKYQSHTFMLS